MTAGPLINFPSRFAFVNPDGTLTTEALRMLRKWFVTLGGPNGATVADVDLLAQFDAAPAAAPENAIEFAPVAEKVQQLESQIEAAQSALAELRKSLESLAVDLMFTTAADVPLVGSTTIAAGVGAVKMSTANNADNVAWIPLEMAGTIYYVPAWATNAP